MYRGLRVTSKECTRNLVQGSHAARPEGLRTSGERTALYELESKLLKGGYKGTYIGDYYRGLFGGDTRSLDSGSYPEPCHVG